MNLFSAMLSLSLSLFFFLFSHSAMEDILLFCTYFFPLQDFPFYTQEQRTKTILANFTDTTAKSLNKSFSFSQLKSSYFKRSKILFELKRFLFIWKNTVYAKMTNKRDFYFFWPVTLEWRGCNLILRNCVELV